MYHSILKEIHRLLKDGLLISHPTGRDAVNELHKTASFDTKDIIQDILCIKDFIEPLGFNLIKGIDEDDFF